MGNDLIFNYFFALTINNIHTYIHIGDNVVVKRPFTLSIEDETRNELKTLAEKKNMTVSAYSAMVLDLHVDMMTDGE